MVQKYRLSATPSSLVLAMEPGMATAGVYWSSPSLVAGLQAALLEQQLSSSPVMQFVQENPVGFVGRELYDRPEGGSQADGGSIRHMAHHIH